MTRYTADELLKQPPSTLPKADLETLLSHRETGVTITHGDETVLDAEPTVVHVSRPRVHDTSTPNNPSSRSIKFTVEVPLTGDETEGDE